MKAEPSVQLVLLEVQALDSRIDGLNHRLGSLPEAQRLAELSARRRTVDDAVRDHRVQVGDLTDEQRRAEADVEQVRARRVRDQAMLDSGSVANPKDLERILGEVESLDRRIGTLEDAELDVMERLEMAQAFLDERSAELTEVDEEVAAFTEQRDRSAGDLGADLVSAREERTATAEGVPTDLLDLYERLRAHNGGVGAAALRARQCGGCWLGLNAMDLASIAKRPEDDVVRCEECDRILVRTPESGLASPL